jgi:hypothetical protein
MTAYWHRGMRAGETPAVATGWVAAAGMTAVMVLAACGGTSGQQSTVTPTPTASAATPTASAAASAAASASGTSTCMSQFTNWRDGSGDGNLMTITNGVADFEGPVIDASFGMLSKADVAQVKTTATSLQAAAKTGQANPPPSCVPGLRADYKAAMADFKKGAQGALDGVKAARSGDMQTAASEIKAADKKIRAASKALDAAVTDMDTFTASG